MNKFHYLLFILSTLLLCSSCASILNRKEVNVKIYAPDSTKVVFNNQTQSTNDGEIIISPKRSKDSLRFTLKNDTISTDFSVKRKISGWFFFNILHNYGLGMLVDLTNDKRFTYKNRFNFKIDCISNEFYISNEKVIPFKKGDFFVYTSPLSAIDVFSIPTVTLGGEYFYLDDMSISAEYGTVYLKYYIKNNSDILKQDKGRSFRYELKFYNLVSILNNPRINEYIGLEARFLRQLYTDDISYTVIDEDIRYYKRENYLVNKSVDIYNIKYGLNFPLGRKFYLDLYSGFGLRIRNVKNPYIYYDPEIHIANTDNHDFFYGNNLEDHYSKYQFNFSLGFKFGYKF